MALPANSSPINTSDTISDTIKTTAGYFTDGDGNLSGTNIVTGSLAASNEKYYYNFLLKNSCGVFRKNIKKCKE